MREVKACGGSSRIVKTDRQVGRVAEMRPGNILKGRGVVLETM